MKVSASTFSTWLSAALGAGLGIAAGVRISSPDLPENSGFNHPPAAPPAREARVKSRFASDDEAIGAVFSAWQDPNRLRRGWALQRVLERLGARQLGVIVQRVAELRDERMRDLLAIFLTEWTRTDPDAARAWMRPVLDRMEAGAETDSDWDLVKVWVQADPRGALAFASELPDSSGAYRLLSEVLEALAADDPAEKIKILEELPARTFPRLRRILLGFAIQELAEKNPAAALGKLGQIMASGERGEGLINIHLTVEDAATADPAAALAWVQSQPAENRRDFTIWAVAGWAESDPIAALEWARTNALPLDATADSEELNPLDSALKADADRTVEWLLDFPPDAERDRLLVGSAGRVEPAVARQIFQELGPDFQVEAAGDIAGIVRRAGRDEAVAWSKEIANGPARRDAITEMVRGERWNSEDPLEDMIALYAPGHDRDAALRGASSSDKESIEASLGYAARISDPAVRAQAFRRLAVRWLKADAAAASAWLAGTGELSPEVKGVVSRMVSDGEWE